MIGLRKAQHDQPAGVHLLLEGNQRLTVVCERTCGYPWYCYLGSMITVLCKGGSQEGRMSHEIEVWRDTAKESSEPLSEANQSECRQL